MVMVQSQCSPILPNVSLIRLAEQMYLFLTFSGAISSDVLQIKLGELENETMQDRRTIAFVVAQMNMDDFSRLVESIQVKLSPIHPNYLELEDEVKLMDESYSPNLHQGPLFSSYNQDFYELYELARWYLSCQNKWKSLKALKARMKAEVKSSLLVLEKRIPQKNFRTRLGRFLDNEGLLPWEEDVLNLFVNESRKIFEQTGDKLWEPLKTVMNNWVHLNGIIISDSPASVEFKEFKQKHHFHKTHQEKIYQLFLSQDKNTTFGMCSPMLNFFLVFYPPIWEMEIEEQTELLYLMKQFINKYSNLKWFPTFLDTLCPIFENLMGEEWDLYRSDLQFLEQHSGLGFSEMVTNIMQTQDSFAEFMKTLANTLVGKQVTFSLPDKSFF